MSSLLVSLSGTPFEMGLQHGRLLKEEIHSLAKERCAAAAELARAAGVKAEHEACLRRAHEQIRCQEQFAPAVHEEFVGIAKGAQLSLEELLIANALVDFSPVRRTGQAAAPAAATVGCTAFAVRRNHTAPAATFIGQTWDAPGYVQPHVHVFLRTPDDGPRTLAVSAAGGLSLIGLNEVGVSISNNRLDAVDCRPGVMYPAIIHEALRKTHFGAACRAVLDARRAAGHNYLLADEDGLIVDLETTAAEVEEFSPREPFFVHANHYLSPRLQAFEREQDLRSSRHRQQRLLGLLQSAAGRIDVADLHRMLADRDGGPELCICQEGDGRQTRTCALVIMSPERRSMWLTAGPPRCSPLARFSLN